MLQPKPSILLEISQGFSSVELAPVHTGHPYMRTQAYHLVRGHSGTVVQDSQWEMFRASVGYTHTFHIVFLIPEVTEVLPIHCGGQRRQSYNA